MGVSVPKPVPPIGDRMKSTLASSLTFFYRLLLSVYPPAYRVEFGNEMYDTFAEGIAEARAQGRLGRFLWNELRDMPWVLAHAYWDGWMTKLQKGMEVLQNIASTSDLPPVPPDGRESWRQTFLELSLFIVAAVLLLIVTYFDGVNAGWQRDPEFLGKLITLLTLPFLLLGLTLGLPRWTYPFGGLLLGYYTFVSYQAGMWLLLLVMMLAFAFLAAAEVLTSPQRSLLPLPLRRIGQSISVDWTRLSFGMFGAMPLVIILAFDDAYLNSRTPYLTLSALAMVICALFYCRSRDKSLQVTVLLAGLTCAIFGAWLDKFYFAGSLMNWVTVPSTGIKELLWLFRLWLQWGLLMVSPALLALMGRAASIRRAVQ